MHCKNGKLAMHTSLDYKILIWIRKYDFNVGWLLELTTLLSLGCSSKFTCTGPLKGAMSKKNISGYVCTKYPKRKT